MSTPGTLGFAREEIGNKIGFAIFLDTGFSRY